MLPTLLLFSCLRHQVIFPSPRPYRLRFFNYSIENTPTLVGVIFRNFSPHHSVCFRCVHELQSWKKRLGQLVRFGSKSLPPFPQCNVDPSHVARGRARLPNIDWWGMGKDMTNGELGGFFKTMHCPKCPYNRKHWNNRNKVGPVSQLFFPGLSERNPKFFIWNWFFDHNFKIKCPISIKFRTHNHENIINVSSNKHK